ncbi:MAG: 50S ribosomal protein L30 [Acidobacteria bacterium]|nr:50S ribosomal protein L30 [Acidobacteriota bacterium]
MASKKKDVKEAGATLKIQYYRSAICTPEKHRLVLKSLGFKRMNQVINREDTPAIRGMVAQVPHLVRILEQ